MTAPRILTAYHPTRIMPRRFDWSARREGDPDGLCGWGASVGSAVADLLAQEDEAADDEAYARYMEDEERRDDAREGFDE